MTHARLWSIVGVAIVLALSTTSTVVEAEHAAASTLVGTDGPGLTVDFTYAETYESSGHGYERFIVTYDQGNLAACFQQIGPGTPEGTYTGILATDICDWFWSYGTFTYEVRHPASPASEATVVSWSFTYDQPGIYEVGWERWSGGSGPAGPVGEDQGSTQVVVVDDPVAHLDAT